MNYPPGIIDKRRRYNAILMLFIIVLITVTECFSLSNILISYIAISITALGVAILIYFDNKLWEKYWEKYNHRQEYCPKCISIQDEGLHCTKCGIKLIPTPRCQKCNSKLKLTKKAIEHHSSGNLKLPTPHFSNCGEPIPNVNPILKT